MAGCKLGLASLGDAEIDELFTKERAWGHQQWRPHRHHWSRHSTQITATTWWSDNSRQGLLASDYRSKFRVWITKELVTTGQWTRLVVLLSAKHNCFHNKHSCDFLLNRWGNNMTVTTFRVRTWNNGMRCMSCYILTRTAFLETTCTPLFHSNHCNLLGGQEAIDVYWHLIFKQSSGPW